MIFRSRLVSTMFYRIKIHLEYLDCCLNWKYLFKTHGSFKHRCISSLQIFIYFETGQCFSKYNVLPTSHSMIWFKMQILIKQGLTFYIYKFSGDVDVVTVVQVENGSISQTLVYTGFMTFQSSSGNSNKQQSWGTTVLRQGPRYISCFLNNFKNNGVERAKENQVTCIENSLLTNKLLK